MGSAKTEFCSGLDSVDFVPKIFDVGALLIFPNNVDPNENPLDADLSLSKANENELAAETGIDVVESVFSSLIGAIAEPPKIDVCAFTVDVWLFPNIDCTGVVGAGAPNWLNMP